MKIIRHTARDMRQALRGVREQLGEDAVILSSRRTGEGVEVTAAVDFDASTLEAGGFADTPPTVAPPAAKAPPTKAPRALAPPPKIIDATPATRAAPSTARPAGSLSATALALTSGRPARTNKAEPTVTFQPLAAETAEEIAPAPSYDQLAALEHPDADFDSGAENDPGTSYNPGAAHDPSADYNPDTSYNPAADYNRGVTHTRGTARNPGPAHDPGADYNPDTSYNPDANYNRGVAHTRGTAGNPGAAHDPGADSNPDTSYNPGANYNRGVAHTRGTARNPGAAHDPGADYNAGASYNRGVAHTRSTAGNPGAAHDPGADYNRDAAYNPGAPAYHPGYDADWISEAAREAVAEHIAAPRAPVLPPAAAPLARATNSQHATPAPRRAATGQAVAEAPPIVHAAAAPQHTTAPPRAAAPVYAASQHAPPAARAAAQATAARAPAQDATPAPRMAARPYTPVGPVAADYSDAASYEVLAAVDPVEELREATLTPLASNEVKATFAAFQAAATPAPAATEAMGNELKTLRRMLETQLAHLAWNDLTRRAPVHTEILRELTEIGITQDLAEHLVRQLPEDTDLTFARRFTIAGLSQYLKVTGDRWLDDGGRVAFVGATGVGKTTTLAKIAVRWVLRHGPRDIALVAADSVRIGAQDQLQSLAQMLGVSVYTPEKFEQLPALLSRLSERLILIDTPGASLRDSQLAGRLAVLANSASKLETALVLATSTQAGAIEEAVRHFAPINPACCVLTKLDEAASLGGVLSTLVRARLPVSYMSEGQRVPEDLRPARALELVSAAVRLAKARGAAADEDLLRRRFGKNAHGIS